MAKKPNVLEFLKCIDYFSEKIPVTVREGERVLCEAESLKWLESHGTVYVLEATLLSAKLGRENIVLQARGRKY